MSNTAVFNANPGEAWEEIGHPVNSNLHPELKLSRRTFEATAQEPSYAERLCLDSFKVLR